VPAFSSTPSAFNNRTKKRAYLKGDVPSLVRWLACLIDSSPDAHLWQRRRVPSSRRFERR